VKFILLFRGALFTKVKLFDLFEEKRAFLVEGVRSKRSKIVETA
jgi:hypothetical protein